nr:hypothetical protein [Klebsiella quasipneumoniae]
MGDIRDELTQKGAQVEELINQLKARQLPARQDEISQQLSMVAAAKLERDKVANSSRWWPRQNSNVIKRFGMFSKRRLRPSAGRPFLILLPPENIKVRFFIPEAMLGKFNIGTKVRLLCDGCAENLISVRR